MPPLSPTRFNNTPLAGRSAGQSKLVIPWLPLVRQFVLLFASTVMKHVAAGQLLRNVGRHLEEEGLGDNTLCLTETFQGYDPPLIQCNDSWRDIDRLVSSCDDILDEEGSWIENRQSLREAARHNGESLLSLLLLLIHKVLRTHGTKAATAILEHCRDRWRAALLEAKAASKEVSHNDIKKIKQLLGTVRNLKKKYPYTNQFGQTFPNVRLGFLLSDQDRRNIRSIVKLNNELQQRRFEILRRQEWILLCEWLLGEQGTAGAIQTLESEIQKHRATLKAISEGIERAFANAATPPPKVNEIQLISRLNQTLDREGGDTVADYFYQMAEQAGVTPKLVAAAILKQGLKFQNESHHPSSWTTFSPIDVVRSLVKYVRRCLGYYSDDVDVDPDEPKTPLDFMAQLSVTSPALHSRLKHAIVPWIEQSKPYAEFPVMQGVKPLTAKFLYCYPNDRSAWTSLLGPGYEFAESDYADGYCLSNPFVAILLQVQFGAPVVAMKEYLRACAIACRSEKELNVPPHLDRYQCPEMRLLAERVRDFVDCRQLLHAALSIHTVRKLPSGQLTLSRMDSRVADVFSRVFWEPAEQPAETLHHLHRRDSRFASTLVRLFPTQADLSDMLRSLKRDDSASKLVCELVRRDVLEELDGRYRINTKFDCQPLDIPRSLIKATRGPLVGLTDEQFISELHKNDQLYCLLFFAVFDAHLRGQLSVNQVPASIVESNRILS